MKLAFCVAKYFPFGGLQRNLLSIALACRARGHDVVIYTYAWESDQPPPGLSVQVVPVRAFSNHGRNISFYKALQPLLAQGAYDGVIGFTKMPGLDIYYAADPCFQAKARCNRPALYRLGPRYRCFVALEKAVFNAAADTQILMLSAAEIAPYRACYGTPLARFHLLPPGIARDRIAPPDAAVRARLRREFGLAEEERLVLLLGSDFRRKGLDRLLRGVAALPPDLRALTRVFAVGQSNVKPFQRLAARLGLQQRVQFIPGSADVPRYLWAADLLVHPAYEENTGNVLLEAIVAGLPVLTTANCGYGFHVAHADAGIVLPLPFAQQRFNEHLVHMLTSAPERKRWSENGIRYGRQHDLYSRPQMATDIITSILKSRSPR